MERVKYNITVNTYTAPMQITRESLCNGATITNTGDKTARINNILLYPGVIGSVLGDSVSIGGNENEIYTGQLTLSFEGAGANPSVQVIQKFFVA